MSYFSVIVPTYNRENLIGTTINSVLKQKFEDWELIIVDDGSTDNTKHTVKDFKDKRIKYFYQENTERGAARNSGVERSSGKYVFFLDSDDIIYPNHLQLAFDNLKELNEPEFFHIRYEEIFGNHTNQIVPLDQTTIKQNIFSQNLIGCQIFLRKDIADRFPFSKNRKLKIGEDWGVLLKIAIRFNLHFTNQVEAGVIQHGKRSMQTAKPDIILESRDILIKELSEDIVIQRNPFILKNVFTELTFLAALSAVLYKRKSLAIKLFLIAARSNLNVIFTRRFLAILKHLLK